MEITDSQLEDFRNIVRAGLEADSPNFYFSIAMLKITDHLIQLYKKGE